MMILASLGLIGLRWVVRYLVSCLAVLFDRWLVRSLSSLSMIAHSKANANTTGNRFPIIWPLLSSFCCLQMTQHHTPYKVMSSDDSTSEPLYGYVFRWPSIRPFIMLCLQITQHHTLYKVMSSGGSVSDPYYIITGLILRHLKTHQNLYEVMSSDDSASEPLCGYVFRWLSMRPFMRLCIQVKIGPFMNVFRLLKVRSS